MFLNYFTIAWRNLRRDSFYSIINIAGLAVGLCAGLVIILFIVDELQYDKYNSKADRIHRLAVEIKYNDNHSKFTYRSAPEAQALMQEFPEIESTVRIRTLGVYFVKSADGMENIKEHRVAWTDSTFFSIFSVKVLEGDPATALKEPASVAVSKKTAQKYFPGKSALGQSLVLDNKYNAQVTAVYEDIPAASHFHFDILVSMTGDWPAAKEAQSTSFSDENFNTYLLLKEGTDPKNLESKFPLYLEKYIGPELSKALGTPFSLKSFTEAGNVYNLSMMPLTDIHLHSNLEGEIEPNGSITYVYLLAIIAAFILTIACINFMNLSTARSSNRAKEVGVRKVMGSMRANLVRQFLTESILVTVVSVWISVALTHLFLPLFNELSGKHLQLPLTSQIFYFVLLSASVVIGTTAGIYPSFFLSGFKPINVLKGHVALGMKSGPIRSTLVVFQFVISIILIVCSITVNRQLSFIQEKKLGFEKDQVIIIHDTYALRPRVQTFKDEVLRLSSIESGTISGYVPIESDWVWRTTGSFWKYGAQPTTENMINVQEWGVDDDYVKTFGLKIKQGRGFSNDFISDSAGVILNEVAVKSLALGDNPIGQKITAFEGYKDLDPNRTQSFTIIGIMENFHFSSVKDNIKPLALFLRPTDGSVSFRFRPAKAAEAVKSIETIWKRMAPGQPFQYSFLDEDFTKMYATEARLGEIFTLFAGLAIIIACLGLFALTAFTAEQRRKEIGIRKVLGASVTGIVLLLSRDYGKLILIAILIAIPIGWYGITQWLENYAYKATIGIWEYALAGGAALIISIFTMSYQSIRAANTNPARSLNNE